ncbi:hypothetical protein EJB05_08325 [Eragrostis curvula]|uniref:DUF4378 domain-containing protein n=1 Tax=Eragrostis curvula TaxID=38414 RepID=A0A5J9WMR8_9POAL|nr:hypothetical protein EJB05_08325 [Eragrostis curvula]
MFMRHIKAYSAKTIHQNMEECSSRKPTVKRLMEDELGKVKQLKIPNDEVQRILADLGHGVCLDQSSTQNIKSKGEPNQSTSTSVSSPSGSLDPRGSKCMKESEENNLELALADFLGQIHKYHDERPHKNCKNKNELCTELKFLIEAKLNELNNPPCSLAYEQNPNNEEIDIDDGKHLCSSQEVGPEKFRDALEMLSSDTELFLKILQKPNSNILESIQSYQNGEIRTKLVPTKMPGNTDSIEGTKSTNQDELATKTHGKESRHIFFWKKEKTNGRHATEGTNGSQPANKIVILKPNPRRGIDPTVATSSTQAPELSATESSKFSIKEVRRRFRIVTSEARKEKAPMCEDNLQKDPQWLKSTTFTIKKDTRQLAEQTSEGKASSSSNAKNNFRPSKRNDGEGKTDSHTNQSSKDEYVFYDEAKKHLTEILKDKSQTTKHPTLQISRSLVRMLSLPQGSPMSPTSNQCSKPSPRSSPRAKDCIDLSSEEANICATYKAKREGFAKEEIQTRDISGNGECDDPVTPHEECECIKEEIQEKTEESVEVDTAHTEEIDKLGCSENNSNARCIPGEQCRQNPSQNMVEEAGENDTEKTECQEPATPRSSIELISQFSPDGSLEKQEQPSPVSVLDPFFNEDVDNLDAEDTIKCELHADILRPQYTIDGESNQEIFWADKDVRLGYIKAFLELSELCTYQNLEVWYLEDELISPCLFEELHHGNQIDDTKLLFDCICEALTEIQRTYFRSTPCLSSLKYKIRAPPMGRSLVSEINKHVERNLHNQFPSTLDQLVCMDLEDGNWMDLRSESEEITVVLWDFILDELLEEVAYDLWI